MKKLLFLVVLTALLGHACEKDPIDIQEDLCKGVICNNGGYCVNGDCQCPPQWTGPSCAQEVAPNKMRVGVITLTSFPLTDGAGGGWDLFDGPDVYLQIKQGSQVIFTTGYVEDLLSQYSWFTTGLEFSNPTATYTISVFDYDDGLSADDPMGGISFTPYQPGKKFPVSYPLQCATCTVAFDFAAIEYFH